MCIKAGPDNNLAESITFNKEKAEWLFMFTPLHFAPWHRKEVCYIAMIDKKIMLDESTNQQVASTLIKMTQADNIKEAPNINNYHSITLCNMNYLLAVDADSFSRVLDLGQKRYKYAFVAIFTMKEYNKELSFKTQQIELNSTVYDKNPMINSSSNGLDILKRLLALCKHMRHAPENSSQSNNAVSDKEADMGYLFHDDKINMKNIQNPEICLNTTGENIGMDIGMEQENNLPPCAPNVSSGEKTDNTKVSRKKTHKCDTYGKEFNQPSNLTKHTRTLTKERRFQCKWPGCGHAFVQKSHLKTHNNNHITHNYFLCLTCGAKYSHKSSLVRHMRSQHTQKKDTNCINSTMDILND